MLSSTCASTTGACHVARRRSSHRCASSCAVSPAAKPHHARAPPTRPVCLSLAVFAPCLVAALTWQDSIGQGSDNAAYEVQPGATKRINDATQLYQCTVYLSFSARARSVVSTPMHALGSALTRERSIIALLAALVREVLVLGFSTFVRFGGARQRNAACRTFGYDTKQWAAHDGLLSVHGQRCPIGEESTPLPANLLGLRQSPDGSDELMPPTTPTTHEMMTRARAASGEAATTGALKPGLWHVHELHMDHFAVCGGPLASPRCVDDFWQMYLTVRATIPPVM